MTSQVVPMPAAVAAWSTIKGELRGKLGKPAESWLESLRLLRVLPCPHAYAYNVADHFQRRRNSFVLVSPLDWLLVEIWAEAGIPLVAILRGIDAAFERYNRHDLVRQINSIAFCQNEVLRATVDMKEAGVGSRWAGQLPDKAPGQTLLVACPPKGRTIFSALQNEAKLSGAAQRQEFGLALTVYPDQWQQQRAQQRFGQGLKFLDREVGACQDA